ncbi:MAG: VOC family protein [Actinobacteria bacterium]|nr:VOC family protein [Actinomycetota bacterium]
MGIRSLAYVRWQTPEAEAWRAFGTDVLGMMAVDAPDSGGVWFRTDDRPYRVAIAPGDTKQVTLGFEVVDDLDLEAVVRDLEDAGVKVHVGSDDEARARRVTGFAAFDDPAGIPVEIVHGPILDHVPVQTPLVSGFVTGPLGMGHAVVATEQTAATVDLYRHVLGFRRRNTMRLAMPDPDGTPYTTMHFLGCNPRHHTLGIVAMPFPGGLVHFMLEAAELDDVGRAFDRVHDLGVPIAMTLGRHSNDHMVSFYCLAPDGTMVEFGWGGLAVDEPETTYEITETSFWGHRPPGRRA